MSDIANPFSDPKYKYLYTDVVFLIGNGISRKDFDLNRLRGKGTIVGCNALYREFSPEILIGVDSKILREIISSGYSDENILLVPANRSVMTGTIRWRSPKGFNTSGAFAMHFIGFILAPKRVFCLGMDAYSGNIFQNTPNYKGSAVTNFKGFWTHYKAGLESLSGAEVFNVNSRNAWQKDCTEMENYHTISYDDFERVLELDRLLDFKIV